MNLKILCISNNVEAREMLTSMAQSDARPTGDQEVHEVE